MEFFFTLMSLSVCNQSKFIISVFFRLSHNPRARETETEAEKISLRMKKLQSQSGAGVYRGQLRWWEGGQRVQVVQ